MSSAGITIELFTDVRALERALSTIKVDGKRFVRDKLTLFDDEVFCLFGINNVIHKFGGVFVWGIQKLFLNSSSPGGVWVVFDALKDVEILGFLRQEQVCLSILFAALEHLVAGFRIIKMDLASVKFEIGDFIFSKDGGHFLKSLNVSSLSRRGVRDF